MEEKKGLEIKKEQETLPTTSTESDSRNMGIWGDKENFVNAQRMAQALASGTMVPKDYQGNIGNCLIALDMADRLKMSPFAVMQSLYLVNGRPSWSAQFITTVINKSGRFRRPLSFEVTGKGKDLACIAWTEDLEGNKIESIEITIKMAEDEGWINKNGSKWKTMPEQMIRYRAASFFGKLHCPDLIMGVYAEDEVKSFTEPSGKTNDKVPNPFAKTPPDAVVEVVDTEYTEAKQEDIFKAYGED